MVSHFRETVRAAPEVPVLTARFEVWTVVDWAIATYATYVAGVAVVSMKRRALAARTGVGGRRNQTRPRGTRVRVALEGAAP